MFVSQGSLWMSYGRWTGERRLGKGVQGGLSITPEELILVWPNWAMAMQLEREGQAGERFRVESL